MFKVTVAPKWRATSSRSRIESIPMMSDAPLSFAPSVAQSPIGHCKNGHAVADLDDAAFGAGEARRKDVGAQHDVLVGEAARYGREVGFRIRHEQVLRPGAVDGVAELPAAHCAAALRVTSVQAVETLPARCDGPDDHPLANRTDPRAPGRALRQRRPVHGQESDPV